MANKYGFRFTPLAESDIDSALSYISITLCNGQAALKLLSDIEKTITTICEFPYSFADCKRFLVQDENIRHVSIDNYVFIYEIREQEKQLNILRFLYSRMDLAKTDIR
ncbi:MAG: type II toxin-antitoxin system RelE/ParE family toxin [Clostridiales bacterium]|nr:type II toxin-antitoxin system RelE/ParE family toxin [Clostridiales bacterium]